MEPKHISALDGLRGVAFLAVFYFHTCILAPYLPMVAMVGWMGVDLFFVLSGFLITGVLLASRGAENYYKAFIMRRLLRIAPVYYVALIVIFWLHPAVYHLIGYKPVPPDTDQFYSFNQQIMYWLNLSNLRSAIRPVEIPLAGAFWSLAIEEQFYLIWPTIVRRVSSRALSWMCVGGVLLSLTLRCLPVTQAYTVIHTNFIYRFTPFRLDGLLLGAWLAVYLHRGQSTVKLRWAALVCLPLSVAILVTTTGGQMNPLNKVLSQYGYTVIAVMFTSLLALLVTPRTPWTNPLSSLLSHPVLRLFGKYSYAMYVFHVPVVVITNPWLQAWCARLGLVPVYPVAFVQLLITLGIGAMSWRAIEGPILRYKHRFAYRVPVQPAAFSVAGS